MKKRIILIIVILMVLIVCLGAGLAFAYFYTDLFKSNKELFLKYISKNSEILEFFNDEDLKAYSEKQKNTPYTSEGTIKTNVTFPDSSQAALALAMQNCNITFNKKTDKANNYMYQNINANYSDSQSLKIELLKNSDIYAFKINDVVNRFVGIENNNLKDLARKTELPESYIAQIPDKIDFEEYNSFDLFTDDEITQIKEKYGKIISESLTDDMFSKETFDTSTVYVLSINQNYVRKILLKLLVTLKDDEMILNKIKTKMISEFNVSSEDADSYINKFKELIESNSNNNSTSDDETTNSTETQNTHNLYIKTYVENGNLVKIDIAFEENNYTTTLAIIKENDGFKFDFIPDNTKPQTYSLSFNKTKSADEIKFDITAANSTQQLFELIIQFSGINTNQVQESSELSFEYYLSSLNGPVPSITDETLFNDNDVSDSDNSSASNPKTKFISRYDNTKTFGVEISRNDVPSENILLINTAPNRESVENLFNQIQSRLKQVNDSKLSTLGLQSNNSPFIYYLPSVIPVGAAIIAQSDKQINPILIATPPIVLTILNTSINLSTYNSTQTMIDNTNIQTFNSRFEFYLGQNKTAPQVKSLYSMVISSNASLNTNGTGHMVTINNEIPTQVPTDLSYEKTYTITAVYDSNGYISGIVYN